MDPETLYRQLGRLLESAPDFSGYGPLSTDQLVWLGRAHALVAESGDLACRAELDMALKIVHSPAKAEGMKQVMLTLYKVLGSAELKAPPGVQGAFIPANSRFDAFAAINKGLQAAQSDILIVDPYMDESVLTDFGGSVATGVPLRLLSDQATVRPSLAAGASMWKTQYPNRPIGIRLAAPRALHDRAIFVDGADAWLLTQSLKDFAKRSPAEIVRANDTAALKIAAYEDMWNTATVLI